MTDAQKTDDVYELMDSQKTHVCTPTDSQKTREYEVTGARKKKTDAQADGFSKN